MKTLLLSLAFAFTAAGAALGQDQAAVAQEQPAASTGAHVPGQMKLGVSVVFGSAVGTNEEGDAKGGAGINLGGEYFITEKLSAAPSFTYFFKSKYEIYGMEISARGSSLNLDARYYFAENNGLSFYGLAGIGVGFATIKIDGNESWAENGSGTESKVGLNIGGGLTYPLENNMELNAQVKYNTPFEQVAIQVGITFPIN